MEYIGEMEGSIPDAIRIIFLIWFINFILDYIKLK